ncbi:MAG: hypothetical protein PVI91_07080 [Gammaproteobacteria bacterium]|jgi:hypothetical protein
MSIHSAAQQSPLPARELPCRTETLWEAIPRTFREFTGRSLYSFGCDSTVTGEERLAVATVCKRPEFRPLLKDIVFDITDLGDVPFVLEDTRRIIVDRLILDSPALAAFHLRHALELVALRSGLPDSRFPATSIAVALLAFHTALSYLDGMIHQEKRIVWGSIPEWMRSIAEHWRHGLYIMDRGSAIDAVMAACRLLLPLQGQDAGDAPAETGRAVVRMALKTVRALRPLAHPVEHILMTGGDSRLVIDEETGLNGYGCSPRPRPWAITFSSCTASSISDLAFQEAEWLRQSLFADARRGRLLDRCEAECQRVRDSISALLRLDRIPGTEIVLTPSGTDGEFYALCLAMGTSKARVCNVLVSSTEIGSGTAHAAAGCHFDTVTPHGEGVETGTPLDGFPSYRIDVPTLELRRGDGKPLTAKQLGKTTRSLVTDAVRKGERVLIHLLDCSKTGIGGPSIQTVRELMHDYPTAVSVVVDAAQMRLNRDALQRYLEDGFLVLMTASKFFTGPPFAGALLVPPAIAQRVSHLGPLPRGFAAYSTRQDLPQGWRKLAQTLPQQANLGLLLRWRSALWEMRAFYAVSASSQYNTLRTFGAAVQRMIRKNPDLELVMAPPHDREPKDRELSWDQLPTIFTFLVYRWTKFSERRPLNYVEACFAYRCLNTDIARFLPLQASHSEQELARQCCHIGQPVRVHQHRDQWLGGMRIAAGARLVSGVAFDGALGEAPRERLETEIRTAGLVFGKLSVIVKYWTELSRYDLRSGARPDAGFYWF